MSAYGYAIILLTSWLQSRTPQAMLGRVMGLLMFALVGLDPVSSALAGALVESSAGAPFVGSGALLIALLRLLALSPSVRAMRMKESAGQTA